ncbi:MAG: beta-galactosidase [Victivallales bacterium]|nr:beta-galactosidase [Victivallales bacterium]
MNHRIAQFALLVMTIVSLSAAPVSVLWYDGRSSGGWELDNENPLPTYDAEAGAVTLQCAPKEEGKNSWQCFAYLRPEPPLWSHITFEVRNLGEVPTVVRLNVTQSQERCPGASSWESWTCRQRRPLPPDGEWHEVTFDYDGGWHQHGKSDEEAVPPFQPVNKIGIVFSELPPQTDATFQVRAIRLWEDEAPIAEAPAFAEFFAQTDAPRLAGSAIALPEVKVNFTGRAPHDQRAFFAVSAPAGTQRDWTIPLRFDNNGQFWTIPAQEVKLPKSLPTGHYRVWLQLGEVAATPVEMEITGVEEIGFRRVEVKRPTETNALPLLYIDDNIHCGLMRATFTPGRLGVKVFAECGIDLFGFDTNVSEGGYGLSVMTERMPGEFDWTQFEQRMQEVLEVSPDAMVVLRLYMGTPSWWAEENPGELVCEQDENDNTIPYKYHRHRQPASWSSLPWRELMADRLRNFIAYLEKTPYARHVAGFVLGCGSGEEWMQWENYQIWTDYSEASLKAFRRWLTAKYGSDEALQKAWGKPEVTLATAAIPLRSLRDEIKEPMQQRQLYLPGQPNARWITDYARHLSEDDAEAIECFAHALKEACGGKLLVGSFYGYAMELAGRTVANTGHLDAARLIASPDIDFFCSPTSYTFRQVGGKGTVLPMGADASLRLHDKFWFVEMDVRTFATPEDAGYGRPDTEAGDILQQDKEAIRSLCTGQAQWWFDVGCIPYTNPALMAEISRLVKLFQEAVPNLGTLRWSRADIAVVIDERSLGLVCPNDYNAYDLLRGIMPDLVRLGTTVEYYLASDLERIPERIRMLVFPCSFVPDASQMAALERFKSDGRVLLFLYGPAIADSADPAQAMTEFTGLPMGLKQEGVLAQMTLDAPDGKYLPEALRGKVMATDGSRRYTPCPYVREARDATILGHYPDGGGALAVREYGQWTSVYAAVPALPREFLEVLVEHAGIHRYLTTPDQVWANGIMIGVSVDVPGPRNISLENGKWVRGVYDPLADEEFALDEQGRFTADFAEGATRLFVMLSREEYRRRVQAVSAE